MITIGTLAKTYGKLPHQVKDHASIYDLMVTNVLLSWENKKVDEMMGKKETPNLSQAEMMNMLKSVKKV